MRRISRSGWKTARPVASGLALVGIIAGIGLIPATNAHARPLTPTITITGRVVRDADDKNFDVRTARGRVYHVETSRLQMADAWNKLQAGDAVRVHGEWRDEIIYAGNLRYLGKGYVEPGKRVYYRNYYYRAGDRTNLVGTLVTDADDDEFELRDSRGRSYMIRTRQIRDYRGANKLQKGDRVRVHGYWFIADNKPQLEAMNYRLLSRR